MLIGNSAGIMRAAGNTEEMRRFTACASVWWAWPRPRPGPLEFEQRTLPPPSPREAGGAAAQVGFQPDAVPSRWRSAGSPTYGV